MRLCFLDEFFFILVCVCVCVCVCVMGFALHLLVKASATPDAGVTVPGAGGTRAFRAGLKPAQLGPELGFRV